jgi:hypothetical protein
MSFVEILIKLLLMGSKVFNARQPAASATLAAGWRARGGNPERVRK